MRRNILALALIVAAGATVQAQSGQANASQQTGAEWKAVEAIIGKSGSMQPGDVFKIGLPRNDLSVTVRGVPINPVLALGSWIAFKKMHDQATVMGDLVLTESEVGPVMWSLQQDGIEQTALHNHVLDESPRIMYMHISGHGDASKLAEAIKRALAYTGTPFAAPANATLLKRQPNIAIDTHKLEQILGRTGKDNNGVFQFGIARAEKIMDGDMEVPPSMGVATAINFQPTGEGRAAITGDFVLIASEVNPVIHALRENGIAVTALHSHMLTETPRLFFMHFWAVGPTESVAQGIAAALAKVHTK